MPKPKGPSRGPQPFQKPSRNHDWYVEVAGKQYRLGAAAEKEQAFRLWHEGVANLAAGRPFHGGEEGPGDPTLADVFADYLSVNKPRWTGSTYPDKYKALTRFLAFLPQGIRASELKPVDLGRWQAANPAWKSASTRRFFLRQPLEALAWAARNKVLPVNPLAGYELEEDTRREHVVTPADLEAALSGSPPHLRDYLLLARLTGARPPELRAVTAAHYHADRHCWVFEAVSSKGRKYNRVVYLGPEAEELTRRLADLRPSGPLLRNAEGGPLTASAVRSLLYRLRRRLGQNRAGGFCSYDLRHTFTTQALKNGLNLATVAELLGHRGVKTVARHYSHLAQDAGYLADAATRAVSGAAGPTGPSAPPGGGKAAEGPGARGTSGPGAPGAP